MRRALAALLILSGALLGWTATAVDAATVVASGWWDRNANALLPALDPPPEGALRVANDPAGTSAVAAVRFELDDGERAPTLTLRVVGDPVPEGAAFVACPTTSPWSAASGAPLAEAPVADCEAATALGLVAGDGTAVAFDLAQVAQSATVDVVIGPSPTGESPVTDTFAVDFEAPVPTDITAAGGGPAAPSAPGGSPSGGAAAPPIGGGAVAGSGGGSPSSSPSSPTGGFSSPAGPTVTVPAPGAPAATPPGAGAPATGTIEAEEAATPPLDTATSSSKRWIGLLTAALIIGLGAYLWRADRARAVMTAGPVLGGLGPFVRERTGPAPEVA